MNHLLAALAASAFALSLGSSAVAADTMSAATAKPSSMKSMATAKPMTKATAKPACPKSQHYVSPYTTSKGTKVAGHCSH